LELFLSIEEVALTEEQVEKLGALSDKAYDIKLVDEDSNEIDMSDYGNGGNFKANITLPIVEERENVSVRYAENVEELVNEGISAVDEDDVEVEGDNVEVEVEHFTIYVITDDSATYTDSSNWRDWHDQGFFNDGVHFYDLVPAGETATWSFDSVTPGNYAVFISWSTHPNRATSVTYDLSHDGGVATETINQEQLADQLTIGGSGTWSGWYRVGANEIYAISGSSSLTMTSVDNSDDMNHVIADEVMLVEVYPTDSYVVPVVTAYPRPEISGNLPLNVDGVYTNNVSIVVTIDGVDYPVMTDSNGAWIISQDTISIADALAVGTYDVTITYINSAGNAIVYTSEDVITIEPLDVPEVYGSNVEGIDSLGDIPPAAPCGSYTNGSARRSAVWTDVSADSDLVRYIRHNQRPGGLNDILLGQVNRVTLSNPSDADNLSIVATLTDDYDNNYAGWGTFGGGEGEYRSRTRAYIDLNNDGNYDVGEPISDWSDYCVSIYDNASCKSFWCTTLIS